MKTFEYQKLKDFTIQILTKIGHSAKDAETAANVLLSADLRDVDSHGVARLSGYVRLWEKKRINATPNIKITHETLTTAVIDADEALGLISGPFAMQIAIEKAKKTGSAWVAVNNSNHFGIAGYHAMMALENNMIGFAFTNASPLVAPTFGTERLLGTNPIAVAIPAGEEPPFVLDMATTTAANGKLEILSRKNLDAPVGWIQDKHGNSSTKTDETKNGGALLPLGSDKEHGSHKGYGLGAMVDIFSGVLSGANFGPWVPPFVSFLEPSENPVGKGLGHFFGVISIDGFMTADTFKSRMDTWIKTFKNSKSIENHQVIVPGEPERLFEIDRRKNGIPLHDKVVEDLSQLALRLDVKFVEQI